MKSVEELTSFYQKELKPTVEKFEQQRKKLRFKLIFLFLIVAWNAATIYFFFFFSSDTSYDLAPYFIFGVLAFGSSLYKYLKRDYRAEFKEEVIKPLIKELDPKLNYSANLSVSKSMFERSQLFSRPDRFSGNDFILGQIDNTQIQFSDVHAQKKYKDSKGRVKYSTIFQGLFIVADFNKNFYAQTVVLPDMAQNTFGNIIGSWLQSKNMARDELVKMDNPEFEKEFVVYSDNQIEARYILSHSMMKRLLEYKQKTKHNIYVSFVQNHLHLAIEYNKDLFEPTVFTSLLDEELTKEYIYNLELSVSLVEELKLNEKLWSK